MSQCLNVIANTTNMLPSQGVILLVSDSSESITSIDDMLTEHGYDLIVSSEADIALKLFSSNHVDFVIVDIDNIDMQSERLVYSFSARSKDAFIPIIVMSSADKDSEIVECMSAGGDDFIIKPYSASVLLTRIKSLEQVRELKLLYKNSVNEQLVAKQILAYALSERNKQFEEIKLLSRSKAVFSGDLFLTARTPDNDIQILMADFTGHGLSAAIGALPVADIFSVMSEKGFGLSEILLNINNKLQTLLPVSMFMACSLVKISARTKRAEVWNAGMPDIYIRDGKTNAIANVIKSRHIPLGIADLEIVEADLQIFELEDEHQFIMFTDGFTDAVNSNGSMYGYENILACLKKKVSVDGMFSELVASFNRFCGSVVPDDDVTLACIPCNTNLTKINDVGSDLHIASNSNARWCWYMELSGTSLSSVDPLPIVINEIGKIEGLSVSNEKVSDVLQELYDNALVHGLSKEPGKLVVQEIPASVDNSDELSEYLRIGLKKVDYHGESALLLSIEDSGDGFNHTKVIDQLNADNGSGESSLDGLQRVYQLSDSLCYHGRGNHVEAILR